MGCLLQIIALIITSALIVSADFDRPGPVDRKGNDAIVYNNITKYVLPDTLFYVAMFILMFFGYQMIPSSLISI